MRQACQRLAGEQFGVISRRQALALGMSRHQIDRRVRSGDWCRMCDGVFRLAAFLVRIEQLLVAGCFWGGEEALVSHRSAAAIWGLDGVSLSVAEVTVPGPRSSPLDGLVLHRAGDLLPADRARQGPFVLTDPTRTLMDLGHVVPEGILEAALDSALRRRLTSVPRLRWRLGLTGTRGRKGARALARLVEGRPGFVRGMESPLEVRLRRLLDASLLPAPSVQHEVFDGDRLVARVDFAYPDAMLAIEVDGYAFHHGRQVWQRDLRRRTELARLGWRVLHVMAEDLKRPERVIGTIRAALRATL